jgi:hypothetical protein
MKRLFQVQVVAFLVVVAACNQSKNQAAVLQAGLGSVHSQIDTIVLSPKTPPSLKQREALSAGMYFMV